jgi:hypothetical protein
LSRATEQDCLADISHAATFFRGCFHAPHGAEKGLHPHRAGAGGPRDDLLRRHE